MNVSSEAIRLDWGKAYRKAVNYSIVVTLVCVLQIALLFRQLYYSRTQAAASRVSLLTIGQQAILDALLCFASIAFFKLVIFSIFEIRYMFIIHQSRNSQSANAVSMCDAMLRGRGMTSLTSAFSLSTGKFQWPSPSTCYTSRTFLRHPVLHPFPHLLPRQLPRDHHFLLVLLLGASDRRQRHEGCSPAVESNLYNRDESGSFSGPFVYLRMPGKLCTSSVQ